MHEPLAAMARVHDFREKVGLLCLLWELQGCLFVDHGHSLVRRGVAMGKPTLNPARIEGRFAKSPYSGFVSGSWLFQKDDKREQGRDNKEGEQGRKS